MLMAIILVGSQSSMLPGETTVKQEEPRSIVSGAFEITGPGYVLPNVEYTYTIERADPNADPEPDVCLQILDPNTSASLTRVGAVTYKFICNSIGAYYIRVYGTSSGIDYSYDCWPIVCMDF